MISHDDILYGQDAVIPAFSRELVILLGCLFCLVFSDNETSALKKLLTW